MFSSNFGGGGTGSNLGGTGSCKQTGMFLCFYARYLHQRPMFSCVVFMLTLLLEVVVCVLHFLCCVSKKQCCQMAT